MQSSRHLSKQPARRLGTVSKQHVPAFLALALVLAIFGGVAIGMGAIKGGSRADNPATVVIEPGSSFNTISSKLKEAGVISNEFFFGVAARMEGVAGNLKAGTFELNSNMTHKEIFAALSKGEAFKSVRVTIPEGLRIEQVAAILEEKLGIPAAEYDTLARTGAPQFAEDFVFLRGAYQDSLEGYLFPDTYDFKEGASANEVIRKQLGTFSRVWSEAAQPNAKAQASGLSDQQILTAASVIEKETKIAEERELVSAVIYNRINRNMKLQMCSTVQYLLPDGDSKNKLRLTNADLAIESPYNTYIHAGLPAGPIASPGAAAIKAAFNPSEKDYLFFVLTGKDGSQTFATTEAEFAKAKAKSKEVFGK